MGLPHPDYLPDDLTYQQLIERTEYERSIGRREDLLWGMFMALHANIHRGNESEPLKAPIEYMPYVEEPEETEEEIQERIGRVLHRFAGGQ